MSLTWDWIKKNHKKTPDKDPEKDSIGMEKNHLWILCDATGLECANIPAGHVDPKTVSWAPAKTKRRDYGDKHDPSGKTGCPELLATLDAADARQFIGSKVSGHQIRILVALDDCPGIITRPPPASSTMSDLEQGQALGSHWWSCRNSDVMVGLLHHMTPTPTEDKKDPGPTPSDTHLAGMVCYPSGWIGELLPKLAGEHAVKIAGVFSIPLLALGDLTRKAAASKKPAAALVLGGLQCWLFVVDPGQDLLVAEVFHVGLISLVKAAHDPQDDAGDADFDLHAELGFASRLLKKNNQGAEETLQLLPSQLDDLAQAVAEVILHTLLDRGVGHIDSFYQYGHWAKIDGLTEYFYAPRLLPRIAEHRNKHAKVWQAAQESAGWADSVQPIPDTIKSGTDHRSLLMDIDPKDHARWGLFGNIFPGYEEKIFNDGKYDYYYDKDANKLKNERPERKLRRPINKNETPDNDNQDNGSKDESKNANEDIQSLPAFVKKYFDFFSPDSNKNLLTDKGRKKSNDTKISVAAFVLFSSFLYAFHLFIDARYLDEYNFRTTTLNHIHKQNLESYRNLNVRRLRSTPSVQNVSWAQKLFAISKEINPDIWLTEIRLAEGDGRSSQKRRRLIIHGNIVSPGSGYISSIKDFMQKLNDEKNSFRSGFESIVFKGVELSRDPQDKNGLYRFNLEANFVR
ncbi:MAG: hypothetical protein HQL63_10670 [Magnetococcales bacterium]|nr:hypothetical protein [Magnetococcales bacterium]MBF0321616.1 hypothetical protein [Magnetococcales bacterium]